MVRKCPQQSITAQNFLRCLKFHVLVITAKVLLLVLSLRLLHRFQCLKVSHFLDSSLQLVATVRKCPRQSIMVLNFLRAKVLVQLLPLVVHLLECLKVPNLLE
jgi:hypothetical protein